jgi:hypothetical protein
MAKTATDRILARCATWQSRADLVAALPDIKTLDGIVNTLRRSGRLQQRGAPRAYEYRVDPCWKPRPRGGARPNTGKRAAASPAPVQETPGPSAEPPTAAPPPVLGAGMGLVVGKTAAPVAPERTPRTDTSEAWALARDNVLGLLRNGEMTLDEMVVELESARAELAPLLHDAVEAGHLGMRFSRSQRANVYFLPDPPEGHDQEQDDGAGPLPPLPDSAYPADSAPVLVRPAPDGRARILGPAGLRDRMAAIAGDIADVLDDACDAELPHRLIKNLLAANAGITRALRATEA